jgi:hypothetical protein
MHSGIVAALVATILVIIILLIILPKQANNSNYLYGHWEGDEDFLQESGLQSMSLTLSKPHGNNVDGYLLMISEDDDVVSNQVINLSGITSGGFSTLKSHFSSSAEYKINNASVKCETDDVIPKKINIAVDQSTGTMTLSTSDKLYGILIKDNEMTGYL